VSAYLQTHSVPEDREGGRGREGKISYRLGRTTCWKKKAHGTVPRQKFETRSHIFLVSRVSNFWRSTIGL